MKLNQLSPHASSSCLTHQHYPQPLPVLPAWWTTGFPQNCHYQETLTTTTAKAKPRVYFRGWNNTPGCSWTKWRTSGKSNLFSLVFPPWNDHKIQIYTDSWRIAPGHKIFAKSQGIILLQFLPFPLRTDFSLFLQTWKQQLLLNPVTNILPWDLCQTSFLPDLKCLWPCFQLN